MVRFQFTSFRLKAASSHEGIGSLLQISSANFISISPNLYSAILITTPFSLSTHCRTYIKILHLVDRVVKTSLKYETGSTKMILPAVLPNINYAALLIIVFSTSILVCSKIMHLLPTSQSVKEQKLFCCNNPFIKYCIIYFLAVIMLFAFIKSIKTSHN